jgi:uncharacterized protein YcbK (DUF882 family)
MALINLKDYLTASGKYPDRETSSELTPQYIQNAIDLLERVNGLLEELKVKSAVVSSGYRPSSANASVGGAKRSAHMRCQAIDLQDDAAQSLANKMTPALLRKYGLFMENEAYTKNWVHLDTVQRADRPSRRFIP